MMPITETVSNRNSQTEVRNGTKKIVNQIILMSTIVNLLYNTTNVQAATKEQITNNNSIMHRTSCRNQAYYELRVSCRQMEAQILAATVRIEMNGYHLVGRQRLNLTKGGKSHATVIGDRYLVTHNHYRYSLLEEAAADGEGYTGISLRAMDGKLILENVSLSIINVAYEDEEILVLELVDEQGKNLLENMGLRSAKALDWKSVNWEIGMEIAHIDWDGKTAHVDWVRVEKVTINGVVAYIEVDNYALKGSSGGGAYWNGYHIGNIWAHNLEKDGQTGEVTRLYTMIALNNLEVAELN
jgi:hypothetical protein